MSFAAPNSLAVSIPHAKMTENFALIRSVEQHALYVRTHVPTPPSGASRILKCASRSPPRVSTMCPRQKAATATPISRVSALVLRIPASRARVSV